jgi:hypothetical protein
VTSLAERAGLAPERTLANRIPTERSRDLQEVVLLLVDGSEVRGVLHRTPGTRTLDFLNRQSEAFLAMTDAELTHHGVSEFIFFIAINKAHVVRVTEAIDPE